ncbi:MAG: DUF6851 domain-containing protein [Saprospiraceae bacterium]
MENRNPKLQYLTQYIFICLLLFSGLSLKAQDHSIAREWNELILAAIRNDFARPTIHARNLFHTSIAMYDSWAIFDEEADTYLIGRETENFKSSFDFDELGFLRINKDLDQTISFAIYRIILHRYQNAPKFGETKILIDAFMSARGYDILLTDFDYTTGDPASLGNFIGLEIIKYGLKDGANEQNGYENIFYESVNPPLNPVNNQTVENIDPNRWQPLFFNNFIDQAGNPLPEAIPLFLSPEWGEVEPFSLTESDRTLKSRDNQTYQVYLDPGDPPLLASNRSEEYQWGFSLVSKWSSHLDPTDPTMIDISPASIGNINQFPTTFQEYQSFYKEEGGDWGTGYNQNPITGQPYQEQLVTRGDYSRILAEFWADGPDSETPPGHWFSIINYVMDQPEFNRKYHGEEELPVLEYDVKAYFMLGGAMHDAAIAAWSVKGYYDYIRPISALRYMANLGQSSDAALPNYHAEGIPLQTGYIELIEANDPDFSAPEFLGKIKLKTWKGPDYINDAATDYAGVGWILAEKWWPYQRPSFITPPFAGYVSGHSTYSRAAAEILTYLTDDPYFPGGMGTFEAKQNEFLVFEDGPSTDVTLQWATYRDASDQCSLSRIWGGIHPPVDDIPGRKMGIILGDKVIRNANYYFEGESEEEILTEENKTIVYPNPLKSGENLRVEIDGFFQDIFIINTLQQVIYSKEVDSFNLEISTDGLTPGVYFIVLNNYGYKISKKLIITQ